MQKKTRDNNGKKCSSRILLNYRSRSSQSIARMPIKKIDIETKKEKETK